MKRHWGIGLIGALLLGGLGSGLWQLALQPLFNWLGRVLLTLFTLGIKSGRDSIYQDVARGHHELPSLVMLLVVFAAISSFPIILLTTPAIQRLVRRRLDLSKGEVDARALTVKARRLRYVTVMLMTMLSGVLFVRFLMINQVNLAVTHFEQCGAIISPFVSSAEEREIRSRFARISSGEDYIHLLADMELIAKRNGVTLPPFRVW